MSGISSDLSVKERRILATLTGIEQDITILRELTTKIPGQRMLSKRAGNLISSHRGNNIRTSVKESSKVADLSESIFSTLGPAKRRLYSHEGEDMSAISDLIREYITACKLMLRHFHETNAASFRGIILQCTAHLDSLAEHVSTLDELLEESVSEEGSIPEQTGNAPQYTSNSNTEELNELLGGNAYDPDAPLLSGPLQSKPLRLRKGPTPRLGTPPSLPVQSIEQLRQTAAAAANAERAAAARKQSAAEQEARSATVTATGPRRSLAGLFGPAKGGKTRRSKPSRRVDVKPSRRVDVKPSRRVHVKPRSRTSKNRRN